MSSWFRVDNRLVHGQIVEAWLPHVAAEHLIVANDALAKDMLRQQIVSLAVPEEIRVHFCAMADLPALLDSCPGNRLVLFETCQDARQAAEGGVRMDVLNICNLHHAPGKTQILPCVALSDDDRRDLRHLRQNGVEIDLRRVPSEADTRMTDEQLL